MKKIALLGVLFFAVFAALGAQEEVTVRKGRNDGWELLVDGKPFFVKGVVWSVQPPGTNYTFSLWNESDDTIRKVIDYDAQMMVAAGVNAVRIFSDFPVPPKWIEYLYNKYGIYTIVNYLFARYGITVDGRWYPVTDYSNPRIRETVIATARDIVKMYKDTEGVLMYMFGNENNYGLTWAAGNTIQDIDREGLNTNEDMARALYSLFEEAMQEAKTIDPFRPVGLVNGDVGYMNIIRDECPSLDILGVNMYRGIRPGSSFWQQVKNILDKPVVFTEIGCDAWNTALDREDQYNQALYIAAQWQDIYENAYHMGTGNALGGFVFEWSDEWWKHNADSFEGNDVHDTEGDWSESGYEYDFVPGKPNMNEEWFGITSQGDKTFHSWFRVKNPRASYYTLQSIWTADPWEFAGTTSVGSHFNSLNLGLITIRGIQDSAESHPRWKVKNEFSFAAIQSGEDVRKALKKNSNPLEAFTENQWGAELKTTFWGESNNTFGGRLEGEVTVAMRHDMVIGEPLSSKIDRLPSQGLAERPFDLYSARFNWKGNGAEVNGFYHSGRPDWALSGDFFYFKPECYENYMGDLWDIKLPIGVDAKYNFGMSGDQGLTVTAGPRLYVDALPMLIGKWYQNIGPFSFSAMLAQEIATYSTETNTVEKPVGKASLWFSWKPEMEAGKNLEAQLGVMVSNWQKVNDEFLVYESGGIKRGTIGFVDTLSVKARVNYQPIPYFSTQAEFVYAGLVADTNESAVHGGNTLLFDIGRGNRIEGKLGLMGVYGNYVLNVNALYRRPIVGPVGSPNIEAATFSVLKNRETLAFEAVFSFDMEPATWMWEWNIHDIEGAFFAASLAARYMVYEGPSDPGYFKTEAGQRVWYVEGFPESRGNYNFLLRAFFNPWSDLRIINELEFTRGNPDKGLLAGVLGERPVISGWADRLKIRYKQFIVSGLLAFNLWGTSNTREFNQTFPFRWALDAAWSFNPKPSLLNTNDRVGIRWNGVFRDKYSPNAADGDDAMELVLYFNISF